MDRKTVVVTGANRGIGLEIAKAVARAGCVTVLACRDPLAAEKAAADIQAETANPEVHFVNLDLSSLALVRDHAASIMERFPKIDVLVNNAGVFHPAAHVTADGFEATMGVNYFGPFLLTALLVPAMHAGSRIINITSDAWIAGHMDLSDASLTKARNGFTAYAASKRGVTLWTMALAERLSSRGIRVNAVHPGAVATRILHPDDLFMKLFATMVYHFFAVAPVKGAQTAIYLALSPEVEGVTGRYFADRKDRHLKLSRHLESLKGKLYAATCARLGLEAL